MSKFIAASRQATELDKTMILLEMKIQDMRDECKKWAEVAAKAKEEVTEQQNFQELRTDVVEKETRLDHLQKKNNELSTLLSKKKEDAIVEFKAFKQYNDF